MCPYPTHGLICVCIFVRFTNPYTFAMLHRLFLFALLVLSFSSYRAHAQGAQIKGVIIDKDTKEPLPFTSISLKTEQIGALSNEHGVFIMPAPIQNDKDSLVVMALGYANKAIAVSRGVSVEKVTLEMSKRAVQLDNVLVKGGKVKNLELGARSHSPGEGLLQGLPGSQYAFFVKNEKKKRLGNVRTVSF